MGQRRVTLTKEQEEFIARGKEGRNILVEACIGSGKTTAIQILCDEIGQNKKILYLTYNKLLKLDARAKIRNRNVCVTNYHGFAYTALDRQDLHAGISDLIQTFNREKPPVPRFDVLIIDEYQDIEQESADMLSYIKSKNPAVQIVAVGDMEQKIYDKTTLDVSAFIENFLGDHLTLTFTQCFRLNAQLAETLGRIWQKRIVGVNPNCKTEVMNVTEAIGFLAAQDPADLLCLGSRTSIMADVLNVLESDYPERFNKRTVFASISDRDSTGATEPRADSAIFTTFDASKGLERKVCVIFDFTESYWRMRISRPEQKYTILRNIFCVAASRGKERIVFVTGGEPLLSEKTLSVDTKEGTGRIALNISEMFDFKYKEDVEKCFGLLKIEKSVQDGGIIKIRNRDELIDLSPCIGVYQEAMYFTNYEIEKEILLFLDLHRNKRYLYPERDRDLPLEEKILILTALETGQDRYKMQVRTPYIMPAEREQLTRRLQTMLSPDETIQVGCSISFSDRKNGREKYYAAGFADAVKGDAVYELKFVEELKREHFLQCACYLVALDRKRGILWNTRNNEMYTITVPNRRKFLSAVARTISKNKLDKYHKPR